MGSNYYERRNIYSDEELVESYQRHRSQTKAANELGVSRETVARAVRRSGIEMIGRKYNGKNQSNTKVTDAEIIEESEYMNCLEIAMKHNVSEERVYRRARRLGIQISSRNIGGHWERRSRRYGVAFDGSITLQEVRKRFNDICQICGKPVDDKDIENGHIKRMYPTVDHIIPLSKGGPHTWDNIQLAHMSCNAGKKDKEGGIYVKKSSRCC